MRRFPVFLQKITIVILFLQFSGCHKFIDRVFPGHNSDSNCRIVEIQQGDRTGIFYYGISGYLDSIIFDTESFTSQIFHFEYDNKHRLVAYNGYYDRRPDNYYFKHKYVYGDGGKVIADTARIRQAGSWTQVTFPEYDDEGRVIRETGNIIEAEGDSTVSETTTMFYNYDQNGNLQPLITAISYDDKINYLSTRKVMMFTERNYSKNNPDGAIGYNSQNLPLGFANDLLVGGFLQWARPTEIKYDCPGLNRNSQ